VIPRNVLEWRLDPASQHRHPDPEPRRSRHLAVRRGLPVQPGSRHAAATRVHPRDRC
jgi:hypothetical protein